MTDTRGRACTLETLESRRLLSAGDLDPTFRSAGQLALDLPKPVGILFFVGRQPSGKFIQAGQTGNKTVLLRLNPDGSLDDTFGAAGFVQLPEHLSKHEQAAVDPNSGRIAVVSNGAVLMYTAQGQPDSSFDADGKRALQVAASHVSLGFQSDGKLVIGTIEVLDPDYSDYGAFVTRLNADGSLDTSFGVNGVRLLREGISPANQINEARWLRDIEITPDDKIIVGADFTAFGVEPTLIQTELYRLTPDGNFDASFDGDCKAVVFVETTVTGDPRALDNAQSFYAARVDSAGAVHVLWATFIEKTLTLFYTPRNALHISSFNADGTVASSSGTLDFPMGWLSPDSFAIDPAGNYLLSAARYSDPGTFEGYYVARYSAQGVLDQTYADAGFHREATDGAFGHSSFIYPDGRVLIGQSESMQGTYLLKRLQTDAGVAIQDPPPQDPGPPAPPPHRYGVDATGSLIVRTSDAPDIITLALAPDGKFHLTVNGSSQSFAPSRIKRIALFTLGGNDRVTIGPGVKAVYCELGNGNDRISAGDGNDSVLGGPGRDWLSGNAGDDLLLGGSGNDYLLGGAGNDLLIGNAGDDTLSGAGGKDLLLGGRGADQLLGGLGSDSSDNDPLDRRSSIELFL